MNKIERTKEVLHSVSLKTRRAILFYSTGKDSVVALDLMHEYFDEIICVFMYFVPNLEHINRWLKWAEVRYSKIKLVQVPHWNLSYVLRSGTFCVPNPNVKVFKVAHVDESMRLQYGINWTFYGMKKADSMNRRLMLNTYENGISDTNKVYPLHEWSNKEVLAYMKANKLPEPVRYSKNASGGVGFNIECYLYLKHNEPNDLQKMLKAFPLSEKILFDFDIYKTRKQKQLGKKLTDDETLKYYRSEK